MMTLPYRVALMITLDKLHPVAAWRNYYGITRKVLADSVGMSENEIADIEMSNQHLKEGNLAKLSTVFGIHTAALNIRYHSY